MDIPRVDLTDPTVEPTDAELESLMSAVLADIKESSERAASFVSQEIASAIQKVREEGFCRIERRPHE